GQELHPLHLPEGDGQGKEELGVIPVPLRAHALETGPHGPEGDEAQRDQAEARHRPRPPGGTAGDQEELPEKGHAQEHRKEPFQAGQLFAKQEAEPLAGEPRPALNGTRGHHANTSSKRAWREPCLTRSASASPSRRMRPRSRKTTRSRNPSTSATSWVEMIRLCSPPRNWPIKPRMMRAREARSIHDRGSSRRRRGAFRARVATRRRRARCPLERPPTFRSRRRLMNRRSSSARSGSQSS